MNKLVSIGQSHSGFCNFWHIQECILVVSSINGIDFFAEQFISELDWFEVVHPNKVTTNGDFVSHQVKHSLTDPHEKHHVSSSLRKRITRRSASSFEDVEQVHYQLPIEGFDYHVTLQPNREFISDGLVVERHREGGVKHVRIGSSNATRCHFRGTLRRINDSFPIAQATISTCNGLVSLMRSAVFSVFSLFTAAS